MLDKLENYGFLKEFVQTGSQTVNVRDFNINNISDRFEEILNIFRDGIETDLVSNHFLDVIFGSGDQIKLSLPDLYVNVIMWQFILVSGKNITPEHLVFKEEFTADTIKTYIDRFFILPYRKVSKIMDMNIIINDILKLFKVIDEFSMFLANTCNLKDYVDLMNENPEVYDILHTDGSNYPLETVNKVANERNNRLVDIIKHTKYHCFRFPFISHEAINTKQHREYSVLGGTKPDGNNGIFNRIVNSNYITTGLKDIYEQYIDDNNGRTAQILSKNNVSGSGHFARLIGLNNEDTFLNPDPNYDCCSHNFVKLVLSSEKMISALKSRYYRLNPDGMEYQLVGNEINMIGQTIYLRSPMTCASKSQGHGICYKCYGDVAYVNKDINIGRIAAELISSKLTQKLLSAKHLLESVIRALKWCVGFAMYLCLDGDMISLRDDIDLENKFFVIDQTNIRFESEIDDVEYNQYISSFSLLDASTGVQFDMFTEDSDDMYFTKAMIELLDKYTNDSDIIKIPLEEIGDMNMFIIKINNDGLTETLKQLTNIIDKDAVTKTYNKDSALQSFLEIVCGKGGLNVDSVHCEVIISNQLRDKYNILDMPDWTVPNNQDYQFITLSKALNNNPSITISLSYEQFKRALVNPLTYRKVQASFMDLFFVEKPQDLMGDSEYTNEKFYSDELIDAVKWSPDSQFGKKEEETVKS